MPRKTMLEALTRIKVLARPHASCCELRHAMEMMPPGAAGSMDVADKPSTLQVIARSVSMKSFRKDCAFRGRRTTQNPNSRWFCPVVMNTISGTWLDLS